MNNKMLFSPGALYQKPGIKTNYTTESKVYVHSTYNDLQYQKKNNHLIP